MTLTKQLWLAVAAIMTIAFGISFFVSAWSAKNYLEDQLRLKNVDNANSLALSMSQIDKDPVVIELLIAAQFDIGHYKQIRLTSPAGKVMVERVSDAAPDTVPAWFVNMIPLTSEPGVAQVQNGWRQYGTLTVLSSNRFAYQALWQHSTPCPFSSSQCHATSCDSGMPDPLEPNPFGLARLGGCGGLAIAARTSSRGP